MMPAATSPSEVMLWVFVYSYILFLLRLMMYLVPRNGAETIDDDRNTHTPRRSPASAWLVIASPQYHRRHAE